MDTAIAGRYRAKLYAADYPDGFGKVIGGYTASKIGRISPTKVECPYCHDQMVAWLQAERLARVLRILCQFENGDLEVEVAPVDASMALVGCASCHLNFIMPKEETDG